MDSDEEDEDQFPTYAPRLNTDAGRDITVSEGQGNEAFQSAAQNLASQLRRRGKADEVPGAQTASGNSLFAGKSATTGDPSLAKTEALLSHDRGEQESLTTSLLEMAQQLKQQSMHFSNTLDADKNVVDRALQGLDGNSSNMDVASRRMGTLQRMTEGRGFWARLKLYGMIGGLWVVAFLIVFVGPKIRF